MKSTLVLSGLLLCAVACGDKDKGNVNDSNSRYAGTGAPGFFMAVFSLPGGAESGGANMDWALQLNIPANANSTHAGLRAASNRSKISNTSKTSRLDDTPQWQARLRFEKERRTQIDAEVAYRRQWGAAAPVRGALLAAACSAACSGNTMCWQGSCTANPNVVFVDKTVGVLTRVLAVLDVPGKSAKVNVLLDMNNTAGSEAAVLASAQKFIETLPKELAILGQADHSGAVDIDGDGRMTLVYTMENGTGARSNDYAGLVGFFSSADASSVPQNSDGNVADLLWARVPGATLSTGTPVTADLLAGTMAHEYTHLTSYALRVLTAPPLGQEILWLDEAIAHTMEDLSGWSVSNASLYATALQNWSKGGFADSEDSTDQRGRGYTLVRYVIDQAARAAGATDAGSDAAFAAASSVVSGLLREGQSGFQHPVFANLGQVGAFNWLTAVFVSGDPNQNRPEAHTHDFLDVAQHSITHNLLGFDPHAVYTDASGQAFPLSGPAAEDIDATTDDPSGNMEEASSVLFDVQGFNALNVKQTAAASSIGPLFNVLQITGALQ